MKNFGIVEIGSTNTKAYKYENDTIVDLGFKNIEFKKNHATLGHIAPDDTDALAQYINSLFPNETDVHVYGTSIFRDLPADDIANFKTSLNAQSKIASFNIVSAADENEYTTHGALKNVPLTENICVFIGGGGSTEISICKDGKIMESANTSIGTLDIKKAFPDLSDELATTDINTVSNYITEHLKIPNARAKYLILAGGDFILSSTTAKFPTRPNTLFDSTSHPLMMLYKERRAYEDTFFHKVPLSWLAKKTPDNPGWWSGVRHMSAFVDAVARSTGTEVIFPTRISMVYGIVARLLQSQT